VASMRRGSQPRTRLILPSLPARRQPIVAGRTCKFIAQKGLVSDSRTAPVDVLRVRPAEDVDEVVAAKVKSLLGCLGREEADPLFVFAAGYDPV
jgi:hypothetical protein